MLYKAYKYDKIWRSWFYSHNAIQNKENFGTNLLGKASIEIRNNF